MSRGTRVRCARGTWTLGERLGSGTWGTVYLAHSENGSDAAAVKLVEKHPRASRELLFSDLTDVRNVVPVHEVCETDEHWALLMPRAGKTLRTHMEDNGDAFELIPATDVLIDVATALADLASRDPVVVHRDVKPENLLLFGGRWCLADFGLSRYAEATTGPNTWKDKWSSWYAAPERWTGERATSATDVYALGVIGFELISGTRPFISDDVKQLRDMHCKATPMFPATAPLPLVELVEECLYKPQGARPRAQRLLQRLQSIKNRAAR